MNKGNYRNLIEASYKEKNNEADSIGQKMGYKLDRDLSNAEHKVFIDKDNKPTVAFRGTKPTKIKDLLTDAAIAVGLGRFTPRFRESARLMDKVNKKYGAKSTVIGHSLGGSLAEHVGSKSNKVITLDKGTGIGGILKKTNSNQTDIRSSLDPFSALSIGQSGGKKITINNTKGLKYLNPLLSHDVKQISKLKSNIL